MFSEFIKKYPKLDRNIKKLVNNYYLNNMAERASNRELLAQARQSTIGIKPIADGPLVSVLIPTYNRAKILVERTIPSILAQTYANFEVVVIGDRCTDNTGGLLAALGDKRIKYYNLTERDEYPGCSKDKWHVAGTIPRNIAIERCSGDWLAPLDDDDEFSEDHIESLLENAYKTGSEMVYGKVLWEIRPEEWIELGAYPPRCGRISHLAVLYSARLKFFKYDLNAWRYGEPGDWNMWRRMKEAGVKIGFADKVVGKHYLEGSQKGNVK